MASKRRFLGFLILAALTGGGFFAGGCGGYYVLSVPDQVAPAGGRVPAMARLERNEVFWWTLPVREAPLRFQIKGGPERACGSDKLGWAGVELPAPEEPGIYPLRVSLQDIQGEEKQAEVPLYVWDPLRPVVAVDYNALPKGASAAVAAEALSGIAEKANVLYFTRSDKPTQVTARLRLEQWGFPPGPVLLWERQRWRVVREAGFPRLVFDTRMISPLDELTKQFPNFRAGITDSATAARAFRKVGLEVILVGRRSIQGEGIRYHNDWADLRRQGL